MEVSITRFFSPEEILRLEHGLPRLSQWSSQMLVPFKAQQLRRAKVLWINHRWFLERQMDVACAVVRDRVASWLLDEFAYVVPERREGNDAFTKRVRTLYADRYGMSAGRSVHGGSGRVATIGCFQAKGIGVTPLVGAGANGVHSSGAASVEDGLREAIYAEVAAAEFPHGRFPSLRLWTPGFAHTQRPTRRARRPLARPCDEPSSFVRRCCEWRTPNAHRCS